jgi:hypothetical protein
MLSIPLLVHDNPFHLFLFQGHPAGYKGLRPSWEARCTSSHNFALTHKFSIEFGPIKVEVDIKVNTIERILPCFHALKGLFQAFVAKIRGQRDHFLNPYMAIVISFIPKL